MSLSEEPIGLDPESRKRPADIIIPIWNHSAAWIDMAVVNPCCTTHVNGSAKTPKHALDLTAKNKKRKYAEVIQDAGVTFIPFMMDIYGAMNDEGENCLRRISSIAARKNGKNWKSFYRLSRSKLVCSVLSATAEQILNSFVG
jgi:hypothetical protein